MIKKQLLIGAMITSAVTSLQGMVADSRYFPWYPHVYDRSVEQRSIVQPSIFFVTANHARGDESKEKIGIPEIWGVYDQKALSNAMDIVGLTSPLLGQWQMQREILWEMQGKIRGQGCFLEAEYGSRHGWSIGGSTGIMHVSCNQNFIIPDRTVNEVGLTVAQQQELDRERRQMNEMLGFKSSQWSKSGLIDTELHLRYGLVKDYFMKCRKVDMGIFVGGIFPSGEKRDPEYPFSIPFGGNGHWGFYVGSEGMFELKEDWKLSLRLQVQKRFEKTYQNQRMSVNNEWIGLGALSGPLEIDPGVTFMFSPAFTFGDLRNGWGAGVQYVITNHAGDVWTDMRKDQTIKTTLNSLYKKSSWVAEYVIVTVFYDHDRNIQEKHVHPVVQFEWNIPVHLLGAEKISKTNLLSLGLVFHF